MDRQAGGRASGQADKQTDGSQTKNRLMLLKCLLVAKLRNTAALKTKTAVTSIFKGVEIILQHLSVCRA